MVIHDQFIEQIRTSSSWGQFEISWAGYAEQLRQNEAPEELIACMRGAAEYMFYCQCAIFLTTLNEMQDFLIPMRSDRTIVSLGDVALNMQKLLEAAKTSYRTKNPLSLID